MLGSVFPLTAGAILYGWRAMAVLLWFWLQHWSSRFLWQRIGRRGGSLHISACNLAGDFADDDLLPPHLLVGKDIKDLLAGNSTWMIVPAASLLMVMLLWLHGRAWDFRACIRC